MNCLFVEHLTVIDCAYLDAHRGLVGESWIVDIELKGALDEQSMVLDFGEVKRRLKRAIDQSVDHTLLVPMRSTALSIEPANNGSVRLIFQSERGTIEHRSPEVALSRLDAQNVDTAALTRHLRPMLMTVVPANVAELRLSLRNEAIDGAYFHYVHGLKKHQGQCQRIAHGHRSRIEIRVDGERSPALETALAQRWRDIYLGTREDIAVDTEGRIRFVYTAPEGRFELALDTGCVDLVDTDTTVEQLAERVAELAAANVEPGHAVQVRVYEGVMKGAIALRTAGSAAS
jgi:6-pyruvoyl-tetrahydropterin synthase